jgi:RNA polymerase-binding transcription factor DksA
MSEKTRYTSDELQEFKGIIKEKLALARETEEDLFSELADLQGDQSADSFEQSSNNVNRDEKIALLHAQQKFILGLQGALVRIENGTYGICRISGGLIPKSRLQVVPHATTKVLEKDESQGSGHRPIKARSFMSTL